MEVFGVIRILLIEYLFIIDHDIRDAQPVFARVNEGDGLDEIRSSEDLVELLVIGLVIATDCRR